MSSQPNSPEKPDIRTGFVADSRSKRQFVLGYWKEEIFSVILYLLFKIIVSLQRRDARLLEATKDLDNFFFYASSIERKTNLTHVKKSH